MSIKHLRQRKSSLRSTKLMKHLGMIRSAGYMIRLACQAMNSNKQEQVDLSREVSLEDRALEAMRDSMISSGKEEDQEQEQEAALVMYSKSLKSSSLEELEVVLANKPSRQQREKI